MTRQETRQQRRARQRGGAARRRTWPLIVAVLAVVGAAATVAVLGSDAGVDGGIPTELPTVTGAGLVPLPETGPDPAVGTPAPTATGPALLSDASVVVPAREQATLTVVLAHWCSHCRAEVPELVGWLERGGLPGGIAVRAVVSGNSPTRPNWPPDAWLEREGWTAPALYDADDRVADALGWTGTPFFVVTDAEGAVVARVAGALSIPQVEALLDPVAG